MSKPDPDPDKPKPNPPIPGLYEPSDCVVRGFFKNILMKKYKITDIYDKYSKENNVKVNFNEISMRIPQ